jgi:hypothetical protein
MPAHTSTTRAVATCDSRIRGARHLRIPPAISRHTDGEGPTRVRGCWLEDYLAGIYGGPFEIGRASAGVRRAGTASGERLRQPRHRRRARTHDSSRSLGGRVGCACRLRLTGIRSASSRTAVQFPPSPHWREAQ